MQQSQLIKGESLRFVPGCRTRQGAFSSLRENVPDEARAFWNMVTTQCTKGEDEVRLQFLKFLFAVFCKFMPGVNDDPVGMLFPVGDKVGVICEVCYYPVRTRGKRC